MGGDWWTRPLPAQYSRLQMPLATPQTGASVRRWTLSGTGWFVEGPTSGERGREKERKNRREPHGSCACRLHVLAGAHHIYMI